MEDLGPSPKMQAMLQAIQEIESDEKVVIFAQFTKFLDKIESFFTEKGFSMARIDGTMSATERIHAMQTFNADAGGPTIMLCSLHACGTGINLTRANHVMMAGR
jgi:SNF2 family DNA or RNA helicase